MFLYIWGRPYSVNLVSFWSFGLSSIAKYDNSLLIIIKIDLDSFNLINLCSGISFSADLLCFDLLRKPVHISKANCYQYSSVWHYNKKIQITKAGISLYKSRKKTAMIKLIILNLFVGLFQALCTSVNLQLTSWLFKALQKCIII